ncbi:MAG: AAA family ATPase, partial [Gemmatimonadota bacterium]
HGAGLGATDPREGAHWLAAAAAVQPHRAKHPAALVERLLEAGEAAAAWAVVAEAGESELDDPDRVAEAGRRIEQHVIRRGVPAEAEALTPEFVGRSGELAQLAEAWGRAWEGGRQIVIVSGPTGIGKTRLAEELAGFAAAAGGYVVQAKASASERRLEWGVTAELIRSLYRLPGAAGISGGTEAVLRSLVPSLGAPTSLQHPSPARPVAISDALADLIQAVCYEAPLLVVLDDMQWVDEASVALLQRTARQVRDEPLLVVFTYRSEEISARGLSFTESLVREEGAVALALEPLSPTDVEELLTLSGLEEEGAETVQPLAERLYQVTRGHPLFLVELLRSLQDEGVLVREDDGWRLEGPAPDQLQLPPSVQGVIERRIAHLSAEARRVGQELAELPRGISIERVRLRTGLSDAAFTAGLNELLARDVTRWDAAGRLVFTHDQLRDALGREGKPRRPWEWAAVAVIAIFAIATVLVGLQANAPPYGGGLVLIDAGDSILTISAARLETGDPQPPGEGVWVPDDPELYMTLQPRRLIDGRLVWPGAIQPSAMDAPDASVFWPDGRRALVHPRPGDDMVLDLSPTGERAIWYSEDLSTEEYDVHLRIGSVEGDTGRVIAGPASRVLGEWSPDGSRIAAVVGGAVDSALILSPTGERIRSAAYFHAAYRDWCGNEAILLLVRNDPTDRLSLIRLDIATGEERVLERDAKGQARCSPDGSAYIASRVEDGVLVSYLEELETGTRRELGPAFQGRLSWIPDRLPPVALELRAGPDTLTLAQGETHHLTDSLIFSDGRRRDAEVDHRSMDPSVASVVGNGSIAANRPGRTRVVATYRRWLSDTIVVDVHGDEGPSVVMADDFRTLDEDRWVEVGSPTVASTRVDGGPALALLGDGRYPDGLLGARPRIAERGATIEIELRMPLTAPERQYFKFCLAAMEPPPEPELSGTYAAWQGRNEICMQLPAYELDKWSPHLVRFSVRSGAENIVELPEAVDLAGWTHFAIQLQPDGQASLWIDRERVSTLTVPAAVREKPLRPAILAGTVGTEGHVRHFAWWAEPRLR